MRFQFAVLVLIGAFAFGGLPAGAHHSFDTEFDRDSPMEFDGTVSRFEWKNPHAYLYVDVIDDSGETQTWALQMGAPTVMSRRLGWSPGSVSAGDTVHIAGFRARADDDYSGLAQLVTLPDGEILRASLAFQRSEGRSRRSPR
jgi:hypothetical protein